MHMYDKENMVNIGTYLFRRNLDPMKCLVQQDFKYDVKDTVSGGNAVKYNRYVHEPLYDMAKAQYESRRAIHLRCIYLSHK